MSLKHGLLGFLSAQEMSGYDLEKYFRESVGFFWSAKISQVYRELHKMEELGWLLSKEVMQSGKPNKKIFSITEDGRAQLDKWLINYDMKQDFEARVGILIRMFFAANRPKEESIALLERYRDTCQMVLEQLQGINLDDKELTAMQVASIQSTLLYGRKNYQMQVQWADETIVLLKQVEETGENQ